MDDKLLGRRLLLYVEIRVALSSALALIGAFYLWFGILLVYQPAFAVMSGIVGFEVVCQIETTSRSIEERRRHRGMAATGAGRLHCL